LSESLFYIFIEYLTKPQAFVV
jgi:3-hydroxyacyl-CoA dehydrogenase